MRIVCAWCRREKGPDGRWLPTVIEVPRSEVVTHGICAACCAAVMADLEDRQRTPGPECQREVG